MTLFTQKALEDLSPPYRKRIERLMVAGKTLSQARGHAKITELKVSDLKLSTKNNNNLFLLKQVVKNQDNTEVIKQWNLLQKEAKKAKKSGSADDKAARDRRVKRLIAEIQGTNPDEPSPFNLSPKRNVDEEEDEEELMEEIEEENGQE